MRINIIYVFFLIFLGVFFEEQESFSQITIYRADPQAAEKYFVNHNYSSAIKVYQLLLKKEPTNLEYNQKIAESYLLSGSIKAMAIPPLEFLIKQPKFPNEVWLDLGRAYHFTYRFEEAISAYNTYKGLVSKDKNEVEKINILTEQCYNGRELYKHPLKVLFENLGKNINSETPDFYPVIAPDESVLYYTSRRKGITSDKAEFDGLFSSDILYSQKKDGKWQKAQSVGLQINTNFDEQVLDVSEDGTIMLFYIDHIDLFGDIWIVRRLNNKSAWLKPTPLSDEINAGLETSASIYKNPLTEEEILLVASSRSGTPEIPNYGETDIYMTKKLPTGEWGKLKNLGPNINTKFKEEFPHFSEDGKTLFFASQGHSTMGGFDIFKSLFDEATQTWSAPKNLGYPINTPDNDLSMSFTADPRIAYISAMREGGQGDLDVYRVIFEELEPKETIYRGYVISDDSISAISTAKIEVFDRATNALQGTYIPSPNNCYFVLSIPPGKWKLEASSGGYEIYHEDITIFEEVHKFSPEISKNIKLKKSK